MLYIIATPIGNLEDISPRGLRILKQADLILCEDTRQTRKLLTRFEIKNKVLSYHQHSSLKKVDQIISLLKQDQVIALVSDAGTPGISDPGNKLIEQTLEQISNLKIVPIPGPCALISALSVSGFPCDQFTFFGFPPQKKGRQKFFNQIKEIKSTIVFYESPYRILKTLNALKELFLQDEKQRQIVINRELTKKFETIYRGTAEDILNYLENNSKEIKGEFTVVISPQK